MTGNQQNMFRPMPFWSWNDTIVPKKVSEQIHAMKNQGIGGFVIHARGGLKTEYMGEAWFAAVDAAVDAAETCGMDVWIYDENGWPSGFGNGAVNGIGVEYQQKYLRMGSKEGSRETLIARVDDHEFYYEVNPYYVDTLDNKVTEQFIKKIYEPYYRRYGNRIQGFFTDEPQISRDGIPWSFTLEEAYKNEYGQELLPKLPELFTEAGSYVDTRLRFWRLVTKLFSHSYLKQIGDWCRSRGLKLTGHLLLEETLMSQLTTNGACMASYPYFDIPGVDWLGLCKSDVMGDTKTPLTFKQVESVAHQFGKKQVLTESFAASGHDLNFSDMRGLIEWQMVRGITIVCPHLQGYSIRGVRKRDYPPALFWQQPWWKDYGIYNDRMSRMSRLLTEGEPVFDTLVIHNESSAWVNYSEGCKARIKSYQDSLEETIRILEEKHILFHFGDEVLLEEHGYVEEAKLCIGKQQYCRVVLPEHSILFESTRRLLDAFQRNGGEILTAEAVPENLVIDQKGILYTSRKLENGILHYYVNSSDHEIAAAAIAGDQYLELSSGQWKPFSGAYHFRRNDSLMTLEKTAKASEPVINAEDEWEIVECSENALLLDTCDYYFDGVLQERNGYLLNIQARACEKKRPVTIDLYFHVTIRSVPDQMSLAGEDWENYQVRVNGKEITYRDQGCFIDDSIRKMEIGDSLKAGENVIHLRTEFSQSEQCYENLEKAQIFESEKNKLTYTMEIEPIYLTGDFGVYGNQTEQEGKMNRWISVRDCLIDRRPAQIRLQHIEEQGFLFFAGSMKVRRHVPCLPEELRISMYGMNSAGIWIDGEDCLPVIWEEEVFPMKEKAGNACEMTILLRNNLRNLWGPHHICAEERFTVWPDTFYQEPCLQGNVPSEKWTDDYRIMATGFDMNI